MSTGSATVAIIDCGGANIASLQFALQRLGAVGRPTVDANEIRSASHVILPGVGAARDAMDRLRALGLDKLVPSICQPTLGICLGMQLLCESSEEGNTECLGIVPSQVRRLTAAPNRPVPHMGWNRIQALRPSRLLTGLPDDAYCYFVHSYAVSVSPDTVAVTEYGFDFSAVIERGNFMATQFHPERSGAIGARILANFLALPATDTSWS